MLDSGRIVGIRYQVFYVLDDRHDLQVTSSFQDS